MAAATATTANETVAKSTNQEPQLSTSSNSRPNSIESTTCIELALEGERLCKTGDIKAGILFLEEAAKVGTQDPRTLSSIYCQLGIAYFGLENYQKAREYHELDMHHGHQNGDQLGEAKACGNLGSTLKMLGKFDEALMYCRRHLEMSKKLADSEGEEKALYNIACVHLTQAKRLIQSSGEQHELGGELSLDTKDSLKQAIEYFKKYLEIVTKSDNHKAMGRAMGNLGNTYYLLGDFKESVAYHKLRLEFAKKTNDIAAERRGYFNLGNSNVFLGNLSEAIENFSATLKLSREYNDKDLEAGSCTHLANTYTLLRDHKSAIAYHLEFLDLIKDLDDKPSEGRSCWSLVNLYTMVDEPESALTFAKRHRDIAEQLGDKAGLASAELNIAELEDTIEQRRQAAKVIASSSSSSGNQVESTGANETSTATTTTTNNNNNSTSDIKTRNQQQQQQHHHHHHHHHHHGLASRGKASVVRLSPEKRQEQEQRRFKKHTYTDDLTTDIDGVTTRRRQQPSDRGPVKSSSSERLFDMIAHFQSGRIEDQRCEITHKRPPATGLQTSVKSKFSLMNNNKDSAHDKENDELLSSEPSNSRSGARNSQPSINPMSSAVSAAASAIKATYRKASLAAYPTNGIPAALSLQAQRRPTVSVEHRDQLFELIAGAQGQRMDEQRASLPALAMTNGVLKNPMSGGLLARGHTIDQSPQGTIISSISSQSSQAKLLGSTSKNNRQPLPETIPEVHYQGREKSHSIVPQSSAGSSYSQQQQQQQSDSVNNISSAARLRQHKLTKHSQTIDADNHHNQARDDKFLDTLMKVQSSRFNDQRSEFPKRGRAASLAKETDKGQADNFFNLLAKFQSDRIDDQRSAPPSVKNKLT